MSSSIPGNLTVIIHPGFKFSGAFCGTPGIKYDEMIQLFAEAPRVHVGLPDELNYRRVVSLRQAITEFAGLARREEWTIPGPVPDSAG